MGDSSPVNRLVVISGCSGGGKSTLLSELARRRYLTVEEPGRRIVRQELAGDGLALPWVDGAAFAFRAVSLGRADLAAVDRSGQWVFFDRGLIDAVAGLERATGQLALEPLADEQRYHHQVFLAPPWPEIYVTDAERRHGLDAALAEYEHLLEVYSSLGYDVVILPKITVSRRADSSSERCRRSRRGSRKTPPERPHPRCAPPSRPRLRAGAQTDDRHPGIHASRGLDLEQGERRPLRQHKPSDRRSHP